MVFMLWSVAGLAAHDLLFVRACNLDLLIQSKCAAGSSLQFFLPVLASLDSAFLLALSLVIGVAIHGLHLALDFGKVFDDTARDMVAGEILARATEVNAPVGEDLATKVARPRDDDALFVYAYHSLAESYMIEWARRRRSYGYIGVNWVWATALGLGFGSLLKPFSNLPALAQFWLTSLVTAILVLIAIRVGADLKRDADKMELMWAYSYRHRDIGMAVLPPAGPVMHERGEG